MPNTSIARHFKWNRCQESLVTINWSPSTAVVLRGGRRRNMATYGWALGPRSAPQKQKAIVFTTGYTNYGWLQVWERDEQVHKITQRKNTVRLCWKLDYYKTESRLGFSKSKWLKLLSKIFAINQHHNCDQQRQVVNSGQTVKYSLFNFWILWLSLEALWHALALWFRKSLQFPPTALEL